MLMGNGKSFINGRIVH